MSRDYDIGFEHGAKVVSDATRRDLATFVLRVLGKDRADGTINLGALGRWYATEGQAEEVKCAHAYLDEGDTCAICGKVV